MSAKKNTPHADLAGGAVVNTANTTHTPLSPVNPVPQHVAEYIQKAAQTYNREWLALQRGPTAHLKEAPLPPSSVKTMLDQMTEMKLSPGGWPRFNFVPLTQRQPLDNMLKEVITHPDLLPLHAVRFLLLMDGLVYYPDRAAFIITLDFTKYLTLYHQRQGLSPDLRQISALLVASGLSTELVGYSCLMQMGDSLPFDWEADSVWPFYFEQRSILEAILTEKEAAIPFPRREKEVIQRKAFLVMSRFPSIPEDCGRWLTAIALGNTVTKSARARAVLEKTGAASHWAHLGLNSKRAHERGAAAAWLAELEKRRETAKTEAPLQDSPPTAPPPNRGDEITDYQGYMLDNRRFHHLITEAEYRVGPQEDPRMNFRYVKTDSHRHIQSIIEFSGSENPAQLRNVALVAAYFKPIKEKDLLEITPAPAKMPLNRVPPELLQETENLLKRLAAAGTGYHADWRQKIK